MNGLALSYPGTPSSALSPSLPPPPLVRVCRRCGGRLFRDMEYVGNQRVYFWSCLCCSREFYPDGRLVARPATSREAEEWSRKQGERRLVTV